jgi:hypothetical protein
VPTAERDGEVSGIVDGDHPGISMLALEQRSDKPDGGAGGEEEHDTVALVPGPAESFFRPALVETRIRPGAGEVCGTAAAVRGGC